MKPIFAVPIDDKVLIHSPLQKISALVNPTAALMIRDAVLFDQEPHEKVNALCKALNARPFEVPQPRTGSLQAPMFLGLIPVYGSMTGCIFTDCTAGAEAESVMSLETARQALDAYFELLTRAGQPLADIRIFGAEAFPALDVLFFTEAYARQRAEQENLALHLTLVTDGHLPIKIARWVGDHFNDVTLSLEGLQGVGEDETFDPFEPSISSQVFDNACIFSDSPGDLTLRVCTTRRTINHMGDIAAWIVSSFVPNVVCYQSWMPKCGSGEGLGAVDPVAFARAFNQAAYELEAHGILACHNPVDFHTPRLSACPVGEDALIISPEGRINACPLPLSVWQSESLPFQIGAVSPEGFEIDPVALNDIRALTVLKSPVCEDCISLFHCAGGCYVNNPREGQSGRFSDRCLQTRLVTISNLLRAMDQYEAARDWLDHYDAASHDHKVAKDRLKDFK